MNKEASDLLVQMWKQAALHANKADKCANELAFNQSHAHAEASMAYSHLIMAYMAAHG